ncbi:Zn(II)2Cys6 transcription factor [Aspergillus puulaauensis]|uniref:Zn(2)-C6 fungal-type domain-containing protein n=1 Tax=Aspergillus puulaauensis TaxID=1220207 RepID=A0A7R7XXG6_9EURO|nr:uncharacterized protein APUU_70822A [Aspergillus puulaauensis]BCS29252.1 hypothetical protein APUU_70822A [Aspergillus puulaauensis]
MARSSGSCLSCRARKVRCDRISPRCSQCRQRSLDCVVPEAPPRLLWLPSRTVDDFDLELDQSVDTHVHRQPLFKKGQQAQDSAELLSLISGASLNVVLDQLDYQAEIQNGIASNGPFHAFRSESVPDPSLSPMLPRELPDLELWRMLSNNLGDALDADDIIGHWPNLCIPDDMPDDIPELIASEADTEPQSYRDSELTISPPVSPPADLEGFTMSTAKLLLDHYQNITTTIYTPASADVKTPWEILYIPNVLSTLGEVALTGNSSDAKVSLLFAVLAISAFSLDILSSPEAVSEDWRALGNMYRQKATKRLQMTLRNLSTGLPKKEKYKNILMPLLSMVTICTVSGDMDNAAHYLGDIEQIITLYGLPKLQKSRKVKMLHSIYVYLRVLTESTYIQSQSTSTDTGPDSSKPSTWDILLGELVCTFDTLNLDFMQCLAPPKSTFEQIYSIPDSLFKLILETTQLASAVEKIRHRRHKHTDHDTLAERVKQHETRICEWENYYNETTYPDDPIGTPPLKERFPFHLTQAIYAALVLYFYRSVRDVNVIALQPYVQQTIYHLREYDKHKERHKDRSSDICWPAFIAGCEATTGQARQEIAEWLEKSTRLNGVLMFRVALKAIRRVWAAREVPGKQNLSWGSVLGESDMRVLVLS